MIGEGDDENEKIGLLAAERYKIVMSGEMDGPETCRAGVADALAWTSSCSDH